jgi:hypothetical protein
MKQCPTCKAIFTDDTLRFCLSDGSLLTLTYDPEATHIFTPPQPSAGVVHDRPSPVQPARQGVSPAVVYVLIAALALVVGGGLVAFLKPEAASHTPSPAPTPTPKQEPAKTVSEPQPKKQTNRDAGNLTAPAPTPVERPQQSATPQPPIIDYVLADKSCFELKVMRNEIYARHGYIFKTTDMRIYFSRQSWYRPLYADVSGLLSKEEERDARQLKQYERRRGCS